MTTGQLKLRQDTATKTFLLALGILLAWASYLIAEPFLTALLWAGILAIVFAPLHERLGRWIKNEDARALASTLATVLTAILPFVFLLLVVSRELADGVNYLRLHPQSVNEWQQKISQHRYAAPTWHWAQRQLQRLGTDVNEIASEAAQRGGTLALGLIRGTVTNLTAFFANLILVSFTLFFFFRDGPEIVRQLKRAVPIANETADEIGQTIAEVVRASLNGVLLISLIKGLLAGVAFALLGLPSPALWGTVGAVASLIPVIGISLVWIPAALTLWVQGATMKALFLAIYGATALSLIDNVLYPFLVKGQVRLHTLLVFFSALGGLGVFGFLGFVLGPVVTTLVMALIQAASEYYGRPVEEENEGRRD